MIACWEEHGLVEPRVSTENLLYSYYIRGYRVTYPPPPYANHQWIIVVY